MTVAGEIMKKAAIILLCIISLALLPSSTVYAQSVYTETHTIEISTEGDSLSVSESLTIKGSSGNTYETITFWIYSGAENINILINNNEPDEITPSDNEYICNISKLVIPMNVTMEVAITYTLGKDVKEFTKTVIHTTNSLSVTFDGNTIYTAENLAEGSSFTLELYKPTEVPLSWYIIIFIALLIILLVVTTLYAFKRQKSTTIKSITGKSEELLSTKKALLMSLLKDIEKQHRSKQISDDTYHKLKEEYKQQAVDAMKKLEDISSEVK